MYLLEKQPNVVKIAGIESGGSPGQYPTVIFSELFSQGDPLVINHEKGQFNKALTDRLVNRTIDTAERTGLQLILTVFGQTTSALIGYIEYLADLSTYNGPIAVDGANHEVRLPAIKHALEIGLQDRLIYDALTPDAPDEEFEGLVEHPVSTSVAIGFNLSNIWPEGRLEVLLDNPETGNPGLISRAHAAGFEQLFVDTSVLGGAGSILAAGSVRQMKERIPWPIGGGTANIIDYFASRQERTHLSDRKGLLAEGPIGWSTLADEKTNWLHHVLDTSFDLSIIYAGGDYIFRMIHGINEVMPAIAAVNGMMGYYFSRVLKGKIPNKKQHPLYKYLA